MPARQALAPGASPHQVIAGFCRLFRYVRRNSYRFNDWLYTNLWRDRQQQIAHAQDGNQQFLFIGRFFDFRKALPGIGRVARQPVEIDRLTNGAPHLQFEACKKLGSFNLIFHPEDFSLSIVILQN